MNMIELILVKKHSKKQLIKLKKKQAKIKIHPQDKNNNYLL